MFVAFVYSTSTIVADRGIRIYILCETAGVVRKLTFAADAEKKWGEAETFFLLFRGSGRNKAQEPGVETGAMCLHMFAYSSLMKSRHTGGVALMISGSEMSTKSELYSVYRGLCPQQ